MDTCYLASRCHGIVAERLVEPHDVPPLLAAGSIASLVLLLAERSAVPSRVTRLDGEPNLWPSDVEMDRLAGRQVYRMLTHRCRKANPRETLDHELLEAALGGPRLAGNPIEPLLEDRDTILAPTTVSLEIVGCVVRIDQPEIPGVLGGTRKALWMQRRCKPEKCPQRCGDDEAIGVALSICIVEP